MSTTTIDISDNGLAFRRDLAPGTIFVYEDDPHCVCAVPSTITWREDLSHRDIVLARDNEAGFSATVIPQESYPTKRVIVMDLSVKRSRTQPDPRIHLQPVA
jgi:hypothetical protein